MNYQFYISEHFKKQLKPHAKKHKGLLGDVLEALQFFDKRQAIPLGASTYKVRVSANDAPRGKRGAFRMVILLIEADRIVAPLAFYSKADLDSVSKKEIMRHVEQIKEELRAK